MKKVKYWDIRRELETRIQKNGGYVNCHAHIDRAYTITQDNFAQSQALRSEKWILNDELRRQSTVDQIYDRMCQAVERMLAQGVTALGSFIDVDCNVKDKAIKAAQKSRDKYADQITIKWLNQSSNGLFNQQKEARYWFDVASDFVDIIGGLLKADANREPEHLDILLSTAKEKNKMVHVHIDELNIPEENETSLLAHKTIEHNMQGKVVGIHGISTNCRPVKDRQKIYKLMQKAELKMIACPISWLNERRSESLSPIHNPVTPVDELLKFNIPVGIGTDNIADIWMPFNDADMWWDLRGLMEMARIYDLDTLVKIATINGREILGLS